jgi:16S rRNA (cytidine1402-2'-O)-methyltransferase
MEQDTAGAGDRPGERGGLPWWQASGVESQSMPAGALYVVALPIGNAADIGLRALWTLARVDAVAAEDTRETRRLLDRYGIGTPLLAAHQHNERAAAERIVARLRAGERIALVSDAGTPAVSDPGALVVRAALDAGLRVVPVPGASSVLAALAAAGLASGPFRFLGFLDTRSQARAQALAAVAAQAEPCVLFEAPHRIADLARELATALPPTRRVVIARELTKKFETLEALEAGALAAWAQAHEPRGEYVVLIDAAPAAVADEATQIDASTARWLAALATALPASKAAAVAAKASGLPRALLYAALTRGATPPGDASEG